MCYRNYPPFQTLFRSLAAIAITVSILTATPQFLPYSLVGRAFGLSFGEDLNLSNTDGDSTVPQIASSGMNVFVVWEDDDSGNDEVLFSSSHDAGISFSDPLNISNTPANSFDPQFAVSVSNVFVVWREAIGASDSDIFFAASNDNGTLFDVPINISNTTDQFSSNPHISASGDNIYVLWEEDVSGIGINDILFAVSTDGGLTFADPINISVSSTQTSNARILGSGSTNVYAVWREFNDTSLVGDIVFAASTDEGDTFATPIKLSGNLSGDAFSQQIAAIDENIYVVWGDALLLNTYFVVSTNEGTSFGEPTNISSSGNVFNANPRISTSGANIFLVWQDDSFGLTDIFFSTSTDNGSTFSSPISISDTGDAAIAFNPRITLSGDGENIFIVWQQDDLADVFLAVSSDGGTTFDDPANISNTNSVGFSAVSEIHSSENRLHIIWQDSSSGGVFDIFETTITDSGIPTIAIEPIDDITPRWDLDPVAIQGTVNGDPTDTISIEWGDGSTNSTIVGGANSWGPISHTYDSSATGSREIIVRLLDASDSERASDSSEIVVQTHSTSLSLGHIPSVTQGSDIVTNGMLTDTDANVPVEGKTITFDGTGAENVSSANTTADGSFSSAGASPDIVNDELLTVQAHFGGDSAYGSSDSNDVGYDTVAPGTTEFIVTFGSPSGPIDLTGFNASIVFDDVAADGSIFVSYCDSPSSPRYIEIADMCLKISPAVSLTTNSAVHITMSYEDLTIPDEHLESEIDMFHEDLSGIVDITESRDLEGNSITGTTTNFSRFIGGVALHSDAAVGTVRHQVFVGDNNELLFEFTETKEISFVNSQVVMGVPEQVTITDPYSNLNSDEKDTVSATISSTSDSTGIAITLEETGEDTGVFEGLFTLSAGESASAEAKLEASPDDEILGSYEAPDRVPFKVILDGVIEAGAAEAFSLEQPATLLPVGDSYELRLLDARLGPEANVTVLMSYANVPVDFDPLQLRMVLRNQTICIDEITHQGLDGIDEDAKALTGTTTTTGQFSLILNVQNTSFGDCLSLGPGGGGGGLPRPGTGIILDAVASVAAGGGGGAGGSNSDGDGQSRGNGGGGNRKVVVTNPSLTLSPESDFEDRPLDRIEISSTGFLDVNGEEISYGSIGQQISIASTFTNQQQVPQSYSFLVMVLNEDGVAIDISWQDGMVESGKTVDLASSWTPGGVGTYTIKVFIWDDMDSPSPLTEAASNNIIVGQNL